MAFNRPEATLAVALDVSKAFDRVWDAGLPHKLKSYGISGQTFGLISSFLSNRQLRVVMNGKSLQEHPDNECWGSSRLHSWSCTFRAIH